MTFLQSVAQDLYARYGEEISSLQMVFPSRRAQLFFSEALTRLIDKPLWEPLYTSFEKIAGKFTPLRKANDFVLLIKLYNVYIEYTKSKESFDRFFFWGKTLLDDFNDIDNHLVNPAMLFKNLKEQKEYEGDFSFLTPEQIEYIRSFWSSFEPAGNGKLQEQFIEIWDVLPAIYENFRASLRENGEAYQGMIYREMAETILSDGVGNLDGRYVFVGFNALSKCERILLSRLRTAGKAEFYWDYDSYYIENHMQEAGYFMRDNIKDFPSPASYENSMFYGFDATKTGKSGENVKSSANRDMFDSMDVHIISAPSDVLQAKALPSILKEMNAPFDSRTAIVLADEKLLIPVLYSLPVDCAETNVTLGYPLQHTPVVALAELFIRLQNSYKTGTYTGFYHKDVLSVLKHRYITAISGNKSAEMLDNIVKNNMVYIPESFFAEDDFLQKVFTPLNNYEELVDYLSDIFTTVASSPVNDDEQAALLREYIFYITKSLNSLKTAIAEHKPDIGKAVFTSLLREVFHSLKIPFTGEPVRGLQVMELRETRALDFENIILMSSNEGCLPAIASRTSFVPYNLRRAYGMPHSGQNEAVAAYYFYRLLQRANKVRLLYSSKADETRTGEMSRYLYQLKFESGLDVKEYSVTYDVNFKPSGAIEVAKDDRIMHELELYTLNNSSKSFSPSSLSSYIACPLKFYFSKIARIKQAETVNEELPANLLGNIIHRVMEHLYKPILNKQVSALEINALIDNKTLLDDLINKFFASEFYKTETLPPDFNENGKMLVFRYVIDRYIRGLLKYDARNTGFVLTDLEKNVSTIYALPAEKGTLNLNMGGIIDRVDSVDINGISTVRIIDYKTGAGHKYPMQFKGVQSLFSRDSEIRNSEVFQTFIYCMMLKMNDAAVKVMPALYFLRKCYSPQFSCEIEDSENKCKVNDFDNYIADFKKQMDACLLELFNPDIPFVQTEDEKTCMRCPYAKICERDLS